MAAITAGGVLLSASLAAAFTPFQLPLVELRRTITLIISPERKVKRLQMEKDNTLKPHYVSKTTVTQPSKEVGEFQYLLSQKDHSSYC